MTAPRYEDCATCSGHGEQVECPRNCDGSHILDVPRICRDCRGLGEIEVVDEVAS